MNSTANEVKMKQTARLAGFIYLMVAVFAGFAQISVRANLIVPGEASLTVHNIIASGSLYRIGFVSDIIGQLFFLILPLVLYRLFKSVDKKLSVFMVILALAGIPIALLNMLNQLAVINLLSGAEYLSAFESGQLNALVMSYLNSQEQGILIAQIFWGLWLFPLGLLACKSQFIPKFIGVFLMIGCFGYAIDSFVNFLFPEMKSLTFPGALMTGISEISFLGWLLIKGVKFKSKNIIPQPA